MDSGFGLSHEQRNWMPAFVLPIQIVATILCWIRLIARFQRSGGQFGLDDVLIAIAWVLGTGVSVVGVLSTYKYGFNRHVWDVPPALYPGGALIAFIIENLFFFSTCLTKISVLMFYRRLVAGAYSKTFKWAIWAAIAFVIVYTIVFFALLITTCSPVEAIWMQFSFEWTSTHKYKCVSNATIEAASKAAGGLSVVSDFYSVMLPAVLLMRIRINKRQRYGLMFIFGMGYLVVAAGIARTVYLARVQGAQPDKTWFAFNVFAASVAECNVAIMCACAPSLKSVFGKYFKDLTTKFTRNGESSFSSRVASKMRRTGSRFGFEKLSFSKSLRSKKGFESNVTTSTGRRPSSTLDLPKTGKTDVGSFVETHEYALESLDRVSEAQEESTSPRKNSKTSVLVLLDPENNVRGARMSPLTPAYPGRLDAASPFRSLPSEDDESTIFGANLNFSHFAFNASDRFSNEDEAHLIASSDTKDYTVPISPRELPRSSSALSRSQSRRTSAQIRSPPPAIVSDRGSSIVVPWDEPSNLQPERMGSQRMSDGARPKPRRKLSKDKWEEKK